MSFSTLRRPWGASFPSAVPTLLLISTLAVLLSLPAPLVHGDDAVAEPAPDTLQLVNGDHLTGTAVRLESGSLAFETSWGGKLTVDWAQVARLTTTNPTRLVTADGTRLQGVISSPEDGRLRIAAVGLDPAPSLALADVVALNPPEVPPVRLSGDVQFSLVSVSGNTDNENLVLQGQVVARTERSRYTASAQVNEAEENGEETASKATVGLEYDYFLEERWYFNTSARLTEDEFRDLNLRSTLGVAVGHQFIDREEVSLSLELGASYVNEDFILAADDNYAAARWALDAEHPLGSAVSFFHGHEGLISVEDSDDLLILTRTGLNFSLLKNFVASAQLQWDWDNSPSPGLEKEDTTVLLTLGYAW